MPRSRLPLDLSVGERIQARRRLRRWSIRYAASRAGIAHTTWSRIEKGELRTDRYMITDLAAALECSVTDLTGQPYSPADRRLEAAQIHAEQLWRTMMAHPLTEPPSGEVVMDAVAVEREAGLVRDLYCRCDYAGALARLVGLVPALHGQAHGKDATAVLRLMVPVYGAAMGSLLNVGFPAYAWLAVERCSEAAQRLEDRPALAVAAANRARVSASAGAYGPARTVCDRAANDLEGHLSDPTALDVLGFLHLARSHHMTGLRDNEAAATHLTEAARIAERTGETDSWDLAWGPRNVALWLMAHQLDTGSPGNAVETGAALPVTGLLPIRQVYFYLDMARGLADSRRDEDAVRMLINAERIGPQHTRSSPAARETARALLTTWRRKAASTPLHGLCERMGVTN